MVPSIRDVIGVSRAGVVSDYQDRERQGRRDRAYRMYLWRVLVITNHPGSPPTVLNGTVVAKEPLILLSVIVQT